MFLTLPEWIELGVELFEKKNAFSLIVFFTGCFGDYIIFDLFNLNTSIEPKANQNAVL